MTEQAPTSDLGGEVTGIWLGRDVQALEALADQRGHNAELYAGHVDSDCTPYEAQVEALERSIDGLLRVFGVDPAEWDQQALELRRSNRGRGPLYKEGIQKKMHGRSAGRFLYECATHNLLIEDEEDGWGEVDLVLALNDRVMVTLHAQGDHWSGSHYIDPDTRETLSDAWDDERIARLREELGNTAMDRLIVENEIGYSLAFTARFSRPPKNG